MNIEPYKQSYFLYGGVWRFTPLTMARCGVFLSKLTSLNFSEDTDFCRDNRLSTELKNLQLSGLKGL